MRAYKSLIILYVIYISGCASGSGIQHKKIINQEGQGIDSVCVIPAYKKVSGLGLGPDAKGSKISPNVYLLKPYKFIDGDNIVNGIVGNQRKIIPSPLLLSAGESLSYIRLLVLKSGYKPKILRRSDVYIDKPLILTETGNHEAGRIISYLKAYKAHQVFLRSLFGIQEDIIVQYTDDEILYLDLCIQ